MKLPVLLHLFLVLCTQAWMVHIKRAFCNSDSEYLGEARSTKDCASRVKNAGGKFGSWGLPPLKFWHKKNTRKCYVAYTSSRDCTEGFGHDTQWKFFEIADWVEGEFGPCNVQCGNGYRRRQVKCNTCKSMGGIYDESRCEQHCRELHPHKLKPDTEERCRDRYCLWNDQGWTECSVHCGTGIQSRTVHCDSVSRSEEDCDPMYRPAEQQPCHMPDCDTWWPGKWSVCSTECGEGIQTRTVTCDPDAVCDPEENPVESKVCEGRTCGFSTGTWGPCSVECGQGTQTRSVECPQGSSCTGMTPAKTQRCEKLACKYTIGPWTKCKDGFQSRSVKCEFNKCADRPVEKQPCDEQCQDICASKEKKIRNLEEGSTSCKCPSDQVPEFTLF